MAQPYTANQLACTIAVGREPGIIVKVDWDDDGWNDTASWSDISGDVKRVSGTMAAVNPWKSPGALGKSVTNSCSVTLRNPEDSGGYSGLKYSPSNTLGSLYSAIGDGQIAGKRAFVSFQFGTGASPRQISGYIKQPIESYKARQIEFDIEGREGIYKRDKQSSILYTDVSASEFMTTMAALPGRDAIASGGANILNPSNLIFDKGMQIVPWAWLEDESAWEEMEALAESQLGRVWFDKDGYLHFEDGSHWVKSSDNSYDDPMTQQYTFTTNDFTSVDPFYDYQAIWNAITVEYQPRYRSYNQRVYSATETHVILPDSSKTVSCEFRYPVDDLETPVVGTDIEAVNSGGTGMADSLSVALGSTEYATFAEVTLTNSDENYAAYVTKLELNGKPVVTEKADRYETSDSTSIAKYGRRTWRVSNSYIQTYRHAQMVGDFLLARFKDPVQRLRLAGARGVPWLEVGDRVTVTETLTGIDEDYFIVAIRWSWQAGSAYLFDLELVKRADLYPYIGYYFRLGTHTYGGVLSGRVFW